VKERPNEDTIRRRLRELTEQSRRIRAELTEMIGSEVRSSSRRFLHRQAWNKGAAHSANDRRRTGSRKSGK
jgi:hypothetical protein